MNTTELLTIAEAIVPDRTAMIFDGREFTYAQVSQRVNRLANAMAEMGVTPGDRIATMQVNSHRSIELYFAAAQLDAVYVPINFRAKTEELHQMLRIAGPACLFIGERYLELLGEEDLFRHGPGQGCHHGCRDQYRIDKLRIPSEVGIARAVALP